MFLVNQTSSSQSVTVTLSGSHGVTTGNDVDNYLVGGTIANISGGNQFTYNLPAIGINSGTVIAELIAA